VHDRDNRLVCESNQEAEDKVTFGGWAWGSGDIMAVNGMERMDALRLGGSRRLGTGANAYFALDRLLDTALEGTALGDARRPLGVCWRLVGVQGCSGGASTNEAVDA
jgi:hypothetical protein